MSVTFFAHARDGDLFVPNLGLTPACLLILCEGSKLAPKHFQTGFAGRGPRSLRLFPR